VVSAERFVPPKPTIIFEGRNTIVKNFAEIAQSYNRDPQHLLAFLLRELGTAGLLDGRRVIFKGRVPPQQVLEKFDDYLSTFVLCGECKRPDTHLEKEERTLILRCDACGAHRPVLAKKFAVR
jgi:translation initiation factor 2 subunit 2